MYNTGLKLTNPHLYHVIDYEINEFNKVKDSNYLPVNGGLGKEYISNLSKLHYQQLLGFLNPIKDVLERHIITFKRDILPYDSDGTLVLLLVDTNKETQEKYVRGVFGIYEVKDSSEPYFKLINTKKHLDMKGKLKPDSTLRHNQMYSESSTVISTNKTETTRTFLSLSSPHLDKILDLSAKETLELLNKREGIEIIKKGELDNFSDMDIIKHTGLYTYIHDILKEDPLRDPSVNSIRFIRKPVADTEIILIVRDRFTSTEILVAFILCKLDDLNLLKPEDLQNKKNLQMHTLPLKKYYNSKGTALNPEYAHLESVSSWSISMKNFYNENGDKLDATTPMSAGEQSITQELANSLTSLGKDKLELSLHKYSKYLRSKQVDVLSKEELQEFREIDILRKMGMNLGITAREITSGMEAIGIMATLDYVIFMDRKRVLGVFYFFRTSDTGEILAGEVPIFDYLNTEEDFQPTEMGSDE